MKDFEPVIKYCPETEKTESFLEKLSKKAITLCKEREIKSNKLNFLSFLSTWGGIASYYAFDAGNTTLGYAAAASSATVVLLVVTELAILSVQNKMKL